MTSEERHEARYQRRKAKRMMQRMKIAECYDFRKTFTRKKLRKSYKSCEPGSMWKADPQKYQDGNAMQTYYAKKRLWDGTFRSDGFNEFDLLERGVKRHIRSVTFRERVVQRCLCDYSLDPVIERTFIYDNSASQKNKGYHFAIRRLEHHLQRHYRKHGQEGYILLFDFSKFFDNVSHKVIAKILRKQYSDRWLIGLITHFVNTFGDVGLGLGSQISQILALASANELDHYMKEKCRIKPYGRYMDDGRAIHESKEYLQNCFKEMMKICDKSEIKINMKKTQIVKLSHGFTWLKCRIYLTKTGKVVKKIYKRSVTKMRQKVRAFKRFLDNGEMSLAQIRESCQCWLSYALHFDACLAVKSIVKLIFSVFGEKQAKEILKVKKIKKNRIKKKRRYVQYLINHPDELYKLTA